MISGLTTILLFVAGVDVSRTHHGSIQGVVVNGTRGNEPLADIEVILRAGPEASMTSVAKAKTDIYGKFAFEDIPLDSPSIYQPGAKRNGIYYPGSRHRLDRENRFAQSRIVVFDTVESQSPLVVRKHEIDITVQNDSLAVRETLVVVNPSQTTYVGKRIDENPPTTLALSLPPSFDRVTFDNEFYGRRFRIAEHQPVTDVPWPPGRREISCNYNVPVEKSTGMFRRRLDLPTGDVVVHVQGEDPEQMSCNLAQFRSDSAGAFEAGGKDLDAGFTIALRIRDAPINWTMYARWSSLGVLCALALGTVIIQRRRGG
jgi:hypothetical protein